MGVTEMMRVLRLNFSSEFKCILYMESFPLICDFKVVFQLYIVDYVKFDDSLL